MPSYWRDGYVSCATLRYELHDVGLNFATSSMYPVSGGFYTLISRFVDPSWGFAMGWNYWLVEEELNSDKHVY
jgi:hypothetical protein